MRTLLSSALWTVTVLHGVSAWAQGTPVINPGGILNAAGYNIVSTSVAPGSIATIFGSNLSDGTVCVTPCGPSVDKNGVLIPTLAGASVTFNGVSAPVLSVPNSSQISVQVPMEVAGSSSASVVVTVNGQNSGPVTVPISGTAPGLFSIYANGSGPGAILNARDANLGVVSLVAPWFDFPNSHTAQAGDVIEIYATGLGALTVPVATGAKPAGTPQAAVLPTVSIGGVNATVQFAGDAPCCVGLNQINVTMPSGIQATNPFAVPVTLSIGGQTSNTVTIALGSYLSGFQGTTQTVTGSINNGNIQHLGLDLNPPATMAGSYGFSGSGTTAGGQIVYSLTGSGSGTVSSCLLAGSASSGNWSASGTVTITVTPQGTAGLLLGSFTATTTFTLCGMTLPPRVTNGAMIAGENSSGAVAFTPVIMPPPEAASIWPFTGTVGGGVQGMIVTGGQLFNNYTQVTGGILGTGSLQSGVLSGSGSGTLPCSQVGGSGSGSWSDTLATTLKVSPDPSSLVSGGGSVSGTFVPFTTSSGSACGHNNGSVSLKGGSILGTVFPGGGVTLWLIPGGIVQ